MLFTERVWELGREVASHMPTFESQRPAQRLGDVMTTYKHTVERGEVDMRKWARYE